MHKSISTLIAGTALAASVFAAPLAQATSTFHGSSAAVVEALGSLNSSTWNVDGNGGDSGNNDGVDGNGGDSGNNGGVDGNGGDSGNNGGIDGNDGDSGNNDGIDGNDGDSGNTGGVDDDSGVDGNDGVDDDSGVDGNDGDGDILGSFSAQEQAIFADINAYRADHGIAPITWNDIYHAEAVDWGHTMNNGGFFAHPTDTNRFENIYFTTGNALNATEWWKNSPSHNANMLNPELRNGAVGIVAGSLPDYGSGYFVILRGYF